MEQPYKFITYKYKFHTHPTIPVPIKPLIFAEIHKSTISTISCSHGQTLTCARPGTKFNSSRKSSHAYLPKQETHQLRIQKRSLFTA